MPDITMCCNCNCPKRKKCYRYRAVPDELWQSYANYQPQIVAKLSDPAIYETKCEYFWEINEAVDKTLPFDVVENRYERDEKWKGIK